MGKPSIKRDRPLTPRQRIFVKEWLANGGNGTQAALKAYGCKTDKSAAVCAYRLLRNSKIQQEILKALEVDGLTLDNTVQTLTNELNATKFDKATGKEMADHSTRLKGVEMTLKLMGAFD